MQAFANLGVYLFDTFEGMTAPGDEDVMLHADVTAGFTGTAMRGVGGNAKLALQRTLGFFDQHLAGA